jgi:hypothetical protein
VSELISQKLAVIAVAACETFGVKVFKDVDGDIASYTRRVSEFSHGKGRLGGHGNNVYGYVV